MIQNQRARKSLKHGFLHFLYGFAAILTSVVLFFAVAFFLLFHCMYQTGSDMLAASLLSYRQTAFIPGLYFSDAELDRIRSEYLDPEVEAAQQEEEQAALALAQAIGGATTAPQDDGGVQWMDGIAIVTAPTPFPTAAPTAAPTEAPAGSAQATTQENPMTYTLLGRMQKNTNAYLRKNPSLGAPTVGRMTPGEWCQVLDLRGDFYHILYNGEEYYIYSTMLSVVRVPDVEPGEREF